MRKASADTPRYGMDVGYSVAPDAVSHVDPASKLTLLTDVFTSGVTLSRALETIRQKSGRLPADVIVCVDRKERSEHTSLSAKHTVERAYGTGIHSIIDVEDIIRAAEAGIIDGTAHLDRLKAYQLQYEGV